MSKPVNDPSGLIIIGENIHTTRIVLRNGKRTETAPDGAEAVFFDPSPGERRYLRVPESFKKTQPYEQGQIKHFMIAAMNGIGDDPDEREQGAEYIRAEIRKQVRAGARYLDVNVDEVHYDLDTQKRAMRWTVETVQAASPVPPSIDSSNSEILAEGLAAYDGRAGRPLVNSLSLERPEVLDMVRQHDARVIVLATSDSGMPEDAEQRVENARTVIDMALSGGVEAGDIFCDAVIFPISVDPQYGNHYFDAVRSIRQEYPSLHIGMGLSNVSFGMPNRKLINQTFIRLAIEAGIDAGLIDPIQTKLADVLSLDMESERVKLAVDMLEGRDDFCMNYIQAFRDGRLD
jgi:5-methyltetrahydrofolate--homocysteine methyltransferase